LLLPVLSSNTDFSTRAASGSRQSNTGAFERLGHAKVAVQKEIKRNGTTREEM
jgi:hypothetical protein